MNLTFFSRKYRWPEHYCSVWCFHRNSQKLLTTTQFWVSTILFTNINISLFNQLFWSLFNHRQKSQSNQEQFCMCCSSPCFSVLLCTHYGPLQCFSTYFRKWKEIGLLCLIFPDYDFSCDYGRRFHIKRAFAFWEMRTWDLWKVCLETFRNNRIC